MKPLRTVLIFILTLLACSKEKKPLQPELNKAIKTERNTTLTKEETPSNIKEENPLEETYELLYRPQEINQNHYQNSLQKAKNLRYLDLSLEEKSSLLQQHFTEEIIPYWYGTPWEFEGHTNQPNVGAVACGYFISTTLKHIGFNLNRYRLAQQDATTGAYVLAVDSTNVSYAQQGDDQFYSDILNYQDGLYVAGLSSHVGFILKERDSAWFIHSDYATYGGVAKEYLPDSYAFSASGVCILTPVFHNTELMKKWEGSDTIPVKPY